MSSPWGAAAAFCLAMGGCTQQAADSVVPALPAPGDCGASTYQHLVGQSPPTPAPWSHSGGVVRVYNTGDAVTMDYSDTRLNIELDRASGKIVRITCG
jgi:hypothetical protein